MAFRNVIINNRCKLDYSLNYLVHRSGNEEKRILIDEIKLIVINSTQVSITSCLICELSKKKVKVIFCDDKHRPECETLSYQNNYYSYRKIKQQINWNSDLKKCLWTLIIKEKIRNQARVLFMKNKETQYNLLNSYIEEVELDDISNREGHAAKVYFNALFGNDFSREKDNLKNKFLNYGYSIIAGTISREIKSFGYLTEIGIHHIGESNSFNFTYDLIEPIRPLIDNYVVNEIVNDDNYVKEFVNILQLEVEYNNKKWSLDNAIHLYVQDVLQALNENDISHIDFIKYEL